jgi:hypothetical protein
MRKVFGMAVALIFTTMLPNAGKACTDGDHQCSRNNGYGQPQTCVDGKWEFDVPDAPDCRELGTLCIEDDGFAGCWCSTAPAEAIEQNYYLDSEFDMNTFRVTMPQNIQGVVEVTQEEIVDVTMHNLDELVCLQHVDTLYIHDTITITDGNAQMFPQLTSIGTLIVENNVNLKSIPMIHLVEVANDIVIQNNDGMEDISFLNLEEIGNDLYVYDMESLWRLLFDDLKSIGGDFVLYNTWANEYNFAFYELDEIGDTWLVQENGLLPYKTLCDILDQMSTMPTVDFDNNLPDDCWDETGTFACEC